AVGTRKGSEGVGTRTMPGNPLPCPYCTTQVAPPASPTPGQRVECPRCGELFPWRGPAEPPVAGTATAVQAHALPPAGAVPDAAVRSGPPPDAGPAGPTGGRPPRSNRPVGVAGLRVLLTIAAGGLAPAPVAPDFRPRH